VGAAKGLDAGDGPGPADAPVLAYSLFNAAACRHVRGFGLHRRAELERLRTAGGPDRAIAGDRTVPEFPADAVVLKTAWWPIAGDRQTALPVWDPERNAPRRGGNDYTSWRRVVIVEPPGASGAPGAGNSARVSFAGHEFRDVRRVGLATLPHLPLDAGTAAHLMQDRGARRTAHLALGRDLRAGDALGLVALHVASKDTEDWVWTTAWWHDAPLRGPFAAGRPEGLQGPWRNFLLGVAFDDVAPRAADGGVHVNFNPWLEARFPDGGHGPGSLSNCLACHRRASYPAVDFLPVTRGLPDAARDPAYAPGRLRTQFLWSIALRAGDG
jgi:hypothetical protein